MSPQNGGFKRAFAKKVETWFVTKYAFYIYYFYGPLSYTAVYCDARFQTNSYNCLSYYTNNLANSGFATFLKTGITIFIKSLIIHEENTKEITTVAEVLNRQEICVDLHKHLHFSRFWQGLINSEGHSLYKHIKRLAVPPLSDSKLSRSARVLKSDEGLLLVF